MYCFAFCSSISKSGSVIEPVALTIGRSKWIAQWCAVDIAEHSSVIEPIYIAFIRA